MSAWIVYSKDGAEKCRVSSLEYNGEYLGACSVNLNIQSPTPIEFEIGDWIEYRGERFELNYDPSVVKQSSVNSSDDAFVYENVVFNSLSDELTRCDFLDIVPSDNGMHYSSLPTFSFFSDSITKLAERIQVNLDRVYKDDKAWTIVVHPEYVNKKNINISASNLTCWDALALVKSQFDANFIIKGRTITIGTSGIAVENLFTYGKGNGLYKIERNAESSQKIVTRLRAYGSTRNMPSGYYRNIEGGNVPNNMAVTHLMLPSFPSQTLDPYLDSEKISELGIREGSVFFDGSGDLEEIYPTLEGMTAEDLKNAGVNVNATGELNVVVSAEQIEDDGIAPEEGEIKGSFTITLKDIGFDINDYLGTSTATISMKDGMCGGREFGITSCERSGANYILTCKRAEDTGLGLYFPYKDYQIKSGDKFVLLNLEMPDVYVKAASQRLLKAAQEYLTKNDYVRYSYTPSVDNMYMARQHDEAIKSGSASIHDIIKEGDFLLFEDNDLGISGSITIDSLSIKENADSSIIPEYEITLREEKTIGTIDKIQNQITSIINGSTGASSLNTEQVTSIVKAIGTKMFVRKDKDDTVKGVLSFEKQIKSGDFIQGNLFGAGWSIYKDANGNTVVETDRIVVRKSLEATELIINQETFEKGSTIFVKGGCTITKVEIVNGRYRCYYDNKNGKEFSGFKVGDQARCQRYNASYGGIIKYYWRLVTGVEEDFVELSMTDCDGDGIPEKGDDIAQLGNRTDKTRQSAIVISPDNGGSVVVWAGIDSFNLSERNKVGMGVNPNTGRAYLYGYGDVFFGDRTLEGNYITYQTREGETEPTLNINADIHLGKNSTGLSNLSEFKNVQQDVDDLFGQIEREFTIWYYDHEPTLENEPAVNWVSDADKALHDQDIFFSDKLARAWRFVNGAWIEITDERTLSALKLAEDAKSEADAAKKDAEEAKAEVDGAKQQAIAAENRAANLEYLKDTFGKDESIVEGGVYIARLVSVKNEEENIEAFLNGSDVGKDEEHGKLIIACGIPDGEKSLEERSKEASTRIYEDGTIYTKKAKIEGEFMATIGSVGGFKISGNNLTNEGFSDDAAIIFKHDGNIAAIGSNVIPIESGANGAALFQCHTEDPARIMTNYGIVVSANGTADNVAIGIEGGYIQGFAIKNRIVSSSVTLSRLDTNIIVTAENECTITLPEMQINDDGHVVRIKRVGSGKVNIAHQKCYNLSAGSGYTFPVVLYDRGSYKTNGETIALPDEFDACEFVWVRDLTYKINVGAWIQYKLPSGW